MSVSVYVVSVTKDQGMLWRLVLSWQIVLGCRYRKRALTN